MRLEAGGWRPFDFIFLHYSALSGRVRLRCDDTLRMLLHFYLRGWASRGLERCEYAGVKVWVRHVGTLHDVWSFHWYTSILIL